MSGLLIVRVFLGLTGPAVPARAAAGSGLPLSAIIEILLGLLPFITGFVSFRWSTRSAAEQASAARNAIDAEAYQRVREIYDYPIKNLRDDNDRLRADLAQARNEAAQVHALRLGVEDRDQQITALRRYVDELRRQLGQEGHR